MKPTISSRSTRCLLPLALAAVILVPVFAAAQQGPTATTAQASKHDLTPATFSTLHALVRPQEHEWRHLKVQWLTDVVAARKKAVAEDKPLVICYTGGAGYNEPLGVC